MKLRVCVAVMLIAALWSRSAGAGENVAAEILAMTGARTKIVWSRAGAPSMPKPGDARGNFSIIVLDTNEGRERVLVQDSYCREPYITPSGKRVILDDFETSEKKMFSEKRSIYVIDWDGKNKRELCAAHYAVGVAEDPPGVEWAYYLDNQPGGKLWRVQIDNPKAQEVVWDKTGAGHVWAFTRDGKTACSALPWPDVDIAYLPNKSYQKVCGGGCLVGLGPDGKHFLHCCNSGGDHRAVEVHAGPGMPGKVIVMKDAPGVNGGSLMFPSWSLYDLRFFVISGPQPNTVANLQCNILFGQFNEKFDGVSKWVKVSTCPPGFHDIIACAWIQQGADTGPSSPVAGLNVKLLDAFVKRMDKALKLKPILDEIKKKVDSSKNADEAKEAEEIAKRIDEWGKGQLASARDSEADAPREAETKYKNVAAKLDGLEAGDAAQTRLKDKELQDGIRAWPYVERLLKAEKELVNVPGSESVATDEKFAAKNRLKLDDMKGLGRMIQQQYPSACVIKTANEVLTRYKLDPIIRTQDSSSAGVSSVKTGEIAWPSERKGLNFLWERLNKQLLAFDPAGVAVPAYRLMPRGLARLDRNNAMWLQDGAFTALTLEKFLMVQKNTEFSIEAHLTPENLKAVGLGEIISFSSTADAHNFFLGQLNGKLVLSLKTTENAGPQPVELCTLTEGEPCNILVSYAPGALACYKNGKTATISNNIKGSLSNWSEGHLLFGSNWDGQHAWSGKLEGIALYSRALEAKEVQQNFTAYSSRIRDRKMPLRLEVQAKLLAKSKTPAYEKVAPYTQALVAYEYEVEKVIAGKYDRKTIRVSHYGMMDRKPLAISQAEIGKSYSLTLELFADNPQLETDLPVDELPIDPEAVMYFDVGPLKR